MVKKVDAYEVTFKEHILGGQMDTTVIAGCADEAIDKAKQIFLENVEDSDLELVSIKRIAGLKPLDKKEIEL